MHRPPLGVGAFNLDISWLQLLDVIQVRGLHYITSRSSVVKLYL